MNLRLLPLLLVLALSPTAILQADDLDVTIDVSEVPELEPWAKEARDLAVAWYPKIAARLASEGFTPPSKVALVFKKDMKGVAGTSGDRIAIAADWVKKHPEDKGMVIHELTHVVQSYPRTRAGWLTEGIADHVRFTMFEPETRLKLRNPDKASYRDGYRTTAQFLEWIEKTHDKQIVPTLNAALRKGKYDPELFETATKKSLDDLWKEFVEAQR